MGSGRFLGLGSDRWGGFIVYGALALRLKAGYAVANTGLGTGVSGSNEAYCGSAGNMGNALAIANGDPPNPTSGLYGHPERNQGLRLPRDPPDVALVGTPLIERRGDLLAADVMLSGGSKE
jgi:hypothetical protein